MADRVIRGREGYGAVADEMGRSSDERRAVFAAKTYISDKLLLVGFVVMEDAMGKRFYDHELTEIKNLGGRPSQGGAIGLDTKKAFRTHQDSESIINVIQNGLAVNSENEKK